MSETKSRAAYHRKRYAANAEKIREQKRLWRCAHPEQVRETKRKQWLRLKTRPKNLEEKREQHRKAKYKREGFPTPTRAAPSRCEICGERSLYALCLDHCHVSEKFRGWICRQCNLVLGNARDSPIILRSAATYLERAYA